MQRYRHQLFGKFGQDVLWNVASLGVLALGGIIINMIIARYKGAEALGIFNQVFAIYIVLSQIGVGGIHFSVLKHTSYNQDNPSACTDITTSALILVVIISGLVCIIGFFSVEFFSRLLDSSGVKVGLLAAIPGLLFFSLNKVLINTLNGLRHMKAYAIYRALRYFLLPLSIIIMLLLQLSGDMLSLSLSVTEIILFFALFIYINSQVLRLKLSSNVISWFSKHLSFGLRGMLSGILIEMNSRVDILMLGYFSTDALVGVYSFAAILAEGFSQLPLVLRWNFDPIIGEYFANQEQAKISDLARKVKLVFYPLMGIVGILSVLMYPVLFNFAVPDGGDKVHMSWLVFAIIMSGIIINAGYRPFVGILLQGGLPGSFTLMILALLVSNIVLNVSLIPILGLYGAALATALVYILEAVLLVVSVRKLFRIRL